MFRRQSSNADLGLFVRRDEWEWLRTILSVAKLRELLGKADKSKQIDGCEMHNIHAVHFLLKDHLDKRFNATSGYYSSGKNLCEFRLLPSIRNDGAFPVIHPSIVRCSKPVSHIYNTTLPHLHHVKDVFVYVFR